MSSQNLLRNSIGAKSIQELSTRIVNVWPKFSCESFEKAALNNIEQLGLNERIQQVVLSLENELPKKFNLAVKVLVDSLGAKLQQNNVDGIMLDSPNGFINLAIGEYIATYGMNDFEHSMKALEEITMRFTAESAIRHFIRKHPSKTLTKLIQWSKSENLHLRRLASEGTRPRLPMSSHLTEFIKEPSIILPILENLKNDNELYVRRSVANNLNDISKDNPEVVVSLLKNWSDDKNDNMSWLIKHATRTLVKKGHPNALMLLGFPPPTCIKVKHFELNKSTIRLGESIEISLELTSDNERESDLLIDYIIFHKKANGSLSPKVFKWTIKCISNSKSICISKKHLIKKISTRKYYSGEHQIHLQINGVVLSKRSFILNIPD